MKDLSRKNQLFVVAGFIVFITLGVMWNLREPNDKVAIQKKPEAYMAGYPKNWNLMTISEQRMAITLYRNAQSKIEGEKARRAYMAEVKKYASWGPCLKTAEESGFQHTVRSSNPINIGPQMWGNMTDAQKWYHWDVNQKAKTRKLQ